MDRSEARSAIADALADIAPEVDLAACDPTSSLGEQVDLDSMDVLELLTALAERTGIEIPDSSLPPGWSLDDLVAVLTPS